jgi:hypothetical protein
MVGHYALDARDPGTFPSQLYTDISQTIPPTTAKSDLNISYHKTGNGNEKRPVLPPFFGAPRGA